MAELRDGVALTELGVITRWSLAVRQPEAERADLIAELRADLEWLQTAGPAETVSLPAFTEDVDGPGEELPPDDDVAAEPAPPAGALRRLPRDTTGPAAGQPRKLPAARTAAPASRAALSKPTASRLGATRAPAKGAAAKATVKTAPAKNAPAKNAPAKNASSRGSR